MASNSPRRTALSPAPSSNSSPLSRLQSIANQMAPISTTSFPAEVVPQAPEDPLFGLMRAYKADQSPNKVDLVRGILPPLCSVCPANVAVGADMTTPGNWSVPGRQCEAVGSAGGQEGEFFFFFFVFFFFNGVRLLHRQQQLKPGTLAARTYAGACSPARVSNLFAPPKAPPNSPPHPAFLGGPTLVPACRHSWMLRASSLWRRPSPRCRSNPVL